MIPLPRLLTVMVHFICQLDGTMGAQIRHCFQMCLWGCFWMRLAFESVDSLQWIALPKWLGIIQKAEEGEICPLFSPASLIELGHHISSSPALGLGSISLAPLILRPLNLEWIIPLAFLGLQLADIRFVGLTHLNNCISQFLILSPSPPLLSDLLLVLYLWKTFTSTLTLFNSLTPWRIQ